MTRPLNEIAREISGNWPKPYFGAIPYLGAMGAMNSIDDNYGQDTGRSVVAYFLSNATTWKGDVARAVKKELNAMLKASYGRNK